MLICECLRPRLGRRSTILRVPISTEERVAIALWFLANTLSYRLVGQQFSIARSTVAGILTGVCLEKELELLSLVVKPSPPAEVNNAQNFFQCRLHYFVQCGVSY